MVPPQRSRWPLALAFLLLTLLLPRVSEASRPVITPGREAEILALFEPHALGDELTPGWTLHSFSVDIATIRVWIAGPDETYAGLTLDHIDHAPKGAQMLEGFALKVIEQPPASTAAIEKLIEVIERNDDGSFWQGDVVYAEHTDKEAFRFPDLEPLWDWVRDGLVLFGLFTIVLLVLVARKLRGSPTWMKWTLLAIVLGGAALRLGITPRVALEAWPYTRMLLPARVIFTGPGLAALHPDPVWFSDVITTTTLAFALLTPLAIYVHARYLLDDHRAALIAAGVVAILPLHLRFSHSDVAFIPSIAVSSLTFTLIHVATREPSKLLGWFAVAIIGVPLAVVFLVRPLNIMYVPLLFATAFVNHGVYSEKPKANRVRVGVAFLVVLLVTVFGGIPWLFESFGAQVREGLSWRTLFSAVRVIVSPRMNALLNPVFTPPGLTALAVLGAIDLWRRGKRPLFWFLVLWLFGFLVAHAYVVPDSAYMQARYHLHLIVPFMLLVACGVEAVLRWLAKHRDIKTWLTGRRYQAVIAALIVYVCASPLIHIYFIRYTKHNDASEWLFVHSVREQIPAQCDVIEYVGDGADKRLERVGTYVQSGMPRSRWQVHAISAPDEGEPVIPDEVVALLEDPPECLVWYEGLPCYGNKPLGSAKAPACEAIEGYVRLEPLAKTAFKSIAYDENLAIGLNEGTPIELTVYRAYPHPDR